jgi:hypothetical protein
MYFQNGKLLPLGMSSTFQMDTSQPLPLERADHDLLSSFRRPKVLPLVDSQQAHLKEWEVDNIVGERLIAGFIYS